MARAHRKPFGQRLTDSLREGLRLIENDQPLPATVVPLPPAPPEFRRKDLVELRARLRLTQAGLAAFLNVSEKTVESWEQGSRNPNGAALRLLQAIADPSILQPLAGSGGAKGPAKAIRR